MTTKTIGVREFRQNMTSYYKKALKNDWRYVVVSRNTPIYEVRPISPKVNSLEKLYKDIAEARADYKAGRVYTLEQTRKHFGL